MTNELAMIAEALRALRARDGVDIELKTVGSSYRVIVYEPQDAVCYGRFGEATGSKFPVVYEMALRQMRRKGRMP